MSKRVRQAVFPVAGLAQDFCRPRSPFPRKCSPSSTRPILQHVVEEAYEAGIEHCIFVTGSEQGRHPKTISIWLTNLKIFLLKRGKTKEWQA